MRIFILILLIGFLCECHIGAIKIKRHGNDTLKTIGIFENANSERKLGYMVMISMDTVTVDSSLRATLKRDTFYYTPSSTPIKDSLGNPKLDSIGKPLYSIVYMPTPKAKIIWSANKNIDSLLKINP